MELTNEIVGRIETIVHEAAVSVCVIGSEIFVIYKFEASVSSNTSSIDYNMIQGINVTDFIKKSMVDTSIVSMNKVTFVANLTKHIETHKMMVVKFNKNADYFLFSAY